MDISTGNWFKYLQEEVLTEGLRDIGLPEIIVDFIEEGMPNAPEKSKMYAGNNWKELSLANPGYIDSTQENWLSFMERMFPDQIQLPRATHSPVAARTVEPYDTSAIRTTPRATYDDETIEQNKKIAFVADNIKQAWAKPAGTWRKTFMKATKALSKAGVPSEKVEVVKEELQANMMAQWKTYWGRWNELFSWLNDEPTNYEMIKGLEHISDAYDIAMEDLSNKENPDSIIHTFEDGSYWYNLEVSNCSVEGERMGHCGSDSRGTLVSLRKRQSKRKASSSYITMTWDGETLYQIKGRSNDAPPHEMWDHIEWFIRNMDISSVEETGEHSNDHEGFQEMNEYLQGRNQGVRFNGAIDIDAIQEAIDEVVNEWDGENSSIWGEVNGPEEHGGDHIAMNMSVDCNIQINLGWKGFKEGDGDYIPTVSMDDTTETDHERIPQNNWGTEARDFNSELGLDEIGYDLPGETEVEWEVKMLTGAQPEGEDIDYDYPATAHLIVSIRNSDYESVDDEDEARRMMENLASEVQSEFEDKHDEIREELRAKLAKEGYSVKTAYDRDRSEMSGYELEHWNIYTDKAALEFWFRPATGDNPSDTLVEYGEMPMVMKMWGLDPSRNHDELYSRAFGRPPSPAGRLASRYGNSDLDRNMARTLERMYKKTCADNPDQQELCFGDEYTAKYVPIALAKDSRFVIQGESSYHGQADAYPKMPIGWRYTIGVDSSASPEEIQTVKDIVRYFNKNPQMVMDAARETIDIALEGSISLAEATKAEVISGKQPYAAIKNIDSMLAAQVASGSDEWAERKVMIARWINQNFEQMGEVEKHVAWFQYLSPIRNNQFNMAREGDIEPEGDNAGRPDRWKSKVQDQMKRMKTYSGTVSNYSGIEPSAPQIDTLGEPQAVGESVEQQIERIDALLNELIEVRRYKMHIELSLETTVKSSIEDYKDAIRACKGVTTVQTMNTRRVTERIIATLSIKFALKGQEARKIYLEQVFLPYLRGIQGLELGTAGYTFPEEITKLKEANLSPYLNARNSQPQPVPRMSVQKVAQDWMDGGVMAYDVPMHTHNMAYHVMVPTADLKPYCSRIFRAPSDTFDGAYKNFIKNGPQVPVYVAVGQNGRIKVTGNEDDVWYAMKSGLEELPVFFSYQKQV